MPRLGLLINSTAATLPGGPDMKMAYKRLIDRFPQLFKQAPDAHSPKLVIAIDEAHKLSEPIDDRFRPSHILCRVISNFTTAESDVSNWVLFASTTSQVADFSPPSHIRT